MLRRLIGIGVLGAALTMVAGSGYAAKPAVPDEAKGFAGTIEGTVKEKAPGGNWVAVSVTKAEGGAKNKAKDVAALVGKILPVSCRMSGNDPFPDQKAYMATLKEGDSVKLSVRYNDNAGNIAIRLAEIPAGAATEKKEEAK